MLSPGKHHLLVPREPHKNVRFRKALYARCKDDKGMQAAVREVCAEDILFYVNAFVIQFNPKKQGRRKAGPFVTWPFQEEALLEVLRAIEDQRDIVLEKSREMGASWLCIIALEWLWHFHSFNKFTFMSRKEGLVDSEDPDSLFWKIDFIHRYLPDWLMPGARRNSVKRRGLFFGNAANESAMTGESSTAKSGVGGRATAMFEDEFSQMPDDFSVLHRTSDTADCRIFNGTHLGLDTAFYQLTRRPDMRKLQMHWSQHPEKNPGLYRYDEATGKVEVLDKTYRYPIDFNYVMDGTPVGGPFPGLRSPWYDLQCARKGDMRAIAMDLDINPEGTVSQFFNPILIRTLIGKYCCAPYWRGHLLYETATAKPIKLVKDQLPNVEAGQAYSGALDLWIVPDAEGQLPADRYSLGCDPAQGTGATASCLSGIRASTGEKILEYADANVKPHELAPMAVALCRLLRGDDSGALFIWEQQGPGVQLGLYVLQLGYRSIYYREAELPHKLVREISDRPGWVPNAESKRLLLAEYQVALSTGKMVNRSEAALKECLKFKYSADGRSVEHPEESNTEDPSGARVNHGDRTMADALAWKMAQQLGTGLKRRKEAEGPPVLSLAWRRELHENKRRDEESA